MLNWRNLNFQAKYCVYLSHVSKREVSEIKALCHTYIDKKEKKTEMIVVCVNIRRINL